MRSTVFSGLLLLACAGSTAAVADTIGEQAQQPGPMEYLEVIGVPDPADPAREKELEARAQHEALTKQQCNEQLQLLRENQLQQLREKLVKTRSTEEEQRLQAEQEARRAHKEAVAEEQTGEQESS
ncbi:hypothetical protein [Microbulbifer hainanensis]|uniref:hypothetical protein n=1 Tax=Microbulbifer hainanensis TaxID=2735675 RepID=UPI0018677E47|nr:hypothetical protein [Microbulbifer hainanensis]